MEQSSTDALYYMNTSTSTTTTTVGEEQNSVNHNNSTNNNSSASNTPVAVQMQLKETSTEEKLRVQLMESSRRENVLVMRLTTKEQELQDYILQLNELKGSIALHNANNSLRSSLIDPAVNLIIQRMKKELEETKKKLEDTQNDLNAWKFTPDSNTGKRLMAKCRMLYQENEDLGKMISSGTLAKLESNLALQRSLTDEMKKSQSELDELIQELDEDVEGMQSTIYYLQQQLRESKSNSNNGSNSLSGSSHNNSEIVSVNLCELCAQCRSAHQEKLPQFTTDSPSPGPSAVSPTTIATTHNTNCTNGLKIEPVNIGDTLSKFPNCLPPS